MPSLLERAVSHYCVSSKAPEPVSITVEFFSFERLPPYESLSYTWGKALITEFAEATSPRPIMRCLCISAAYVSHEGPVRWADAMRIDVKGNLWIDSLCKDFRELEIV
ncbi:hypothetical protein N431DRAFT_460815 [Stipitochalara longipes BDJ]|nr:hypothetical protein N431DRAFT_460815 [Stipitochalara longipes BDJ]